jgi:hypothetical protein
MIRPSFKSAYVLSAPPSVLTAVVVIWCCGIARGEEEQTPLWLVVGREELLKPIGALAERRRAEGFEAIVSTEGVEKALAGAPRRPEFLLLVGDDEPGKEAAPWYLPAKRMRLYRWRRTQREEFASDAAWGDLDGDLMPEVAVGRVPARSAAEVELAVKKILAFERRPANPADLGLTLWAGSPNYGPVIDATATELLLAMLRMNGPSWTRLWVVSGNPHHPLCGWPPDQPELFTRQVAQGGLCSVLMGHASAERFFSTLHEGRPVYYQAADARAALAQGSPGAPMVFFSCESGDFTRPSHCMAEAFFFFPGGPVTTIAATTESHPLTNYFSGTCLLKELGGQRDRIGSMWLAAQRQATRQRNFLAERVLRDVEGKLEEAIDVAKLRRDQVLMYALLGDPATRLKVPKPLEASVERVDSGWRWRAQRREGARSLAVGHRPSRLPAAEWTGRPADRQKARAAFEAANAALGFTSLPSPPDDGPWEGTVDRPGLLRLVTVAGGQLYVAVLRLQ